MVKYGWADGSRIKLDPQRSGERIVSIRNGLDKSGSRLTQSVVDDARSPKSPLHDAFEWNNSAAAEEYRLIQARYLCRSLVIVSSSELPELKEPVRALVMVRTDESDTTREYEPLVSVVSQASKMAEVVETALKELRDWEERYRQFAFLLSTCRHVAAAIRTLERTKPVQRSCKTKTARRSRRSKR